MKEQSTDTEKEQADRLGSAYETVGAGDLIAGVHKIPDGDDEWTYRFSIERMSGDRGQNSGGVFLPSDLLDFAKLLEVLASTLVADGCVPRDLKMALSGLAAELAPIVNKRARGRSTGEPQSPAERRRLAR